MTALRLAAIVEGHGEVEAVPLLIRRIASEVAPEAFVKVSPVVRVPADRLRKEGELERQIELAARKLEGSGGILIVIDCDWKDGCPGQEGPVLLRRARRARSDMSISIVLAKKEFEAWFIAAADSVAGQRGLHTELPCIEFPEEIRGAKGWLSRYMPRNSPYVETEDQAPLTAVLDMQAARRADSFDKCYREIEGLLKTLRGKEGMDA